MKKAVKLYVAYWNPNGTNDLYVQFEDGSLEFMAEALSGISCSPVNDGSETAKTLYALFTNKAVSNE